MSAYTWREGDREYLTGYNAPLCGFLVVETDEQANSLTDEYVFSNLRHLDNPDMTLPQIIAKVAELGTVLPPTILTAMTLEWEGFQ